MSLTVGYQKTTFYHNHLDIAMQDCCTEYICPWVDRDWHYKM